MADTYQVCFYQGSPAASVARLLRRRYRLRALPAPKARATQPPDQQVRAPDILRMSVHDHELDPALFELFVDAKIYQLLKTS